MDTFRWLGKREGEDDYEWEWESPTILACEPAPGFLCRVTAMTAPAEDGFVPCFAFTAGLTYEGKYWQGRITDENGIPLPPQAALPEPIDHSWSAHSRVADLFPRMSGLNESSSTPLLRGGRV